MRDGMPLPPVTPAFKPLIRNAHVQSVLAHYWPRRTDTRRYAVESWLFRPEPDVQVRIETQRPQRTPAGHLVMLHGLEGSSRSGYLLSLAKSALDAGYVAHRFNTRTCGGTEHLCRTLYHAGLTSDLLAFVRHLAGQGNAPVWLCGFSLGGNMALKLAGELGETARGLIAGVCAVSTPIDLAACARRIADRDNWIYQRRFLRLMKARLHATGRFAASQYSGLNSLYDLDDRITAPSFGFSGADEYYRTQSAAGFLDRIRVPTLLIQARDDSFIPFEIFSHPAIRTNPCLRLVVTDYGGHVGFLARSGPRFWTDGMIIGWIQEKGKHPGSLRSGDA
jgi:predicted alpha/beta-fold hydrolase